MIRLTVPDIGEEELSVVQDVLRSGYLVQGVHVADFEQSIADYLGCAHAVAVSSCTAALHLSLLALGVGPGDEVIVPDFTFPATANAVELTGARPVFCDIKSSTFCIDPDLIERLITPRSKAIVPVHEFGHPAEMTYIMALADKYGLLVIEDAACALGSEYKGKKVGTFGIAGCFSFHPRKAITTGEGGVIVTGDSALAERLRCLRNHGISIINGRIEFVEAGFNYRMTDLQGALGVVQIRKLTGLIIKRVKLAAHYDQLLKGLDSITTPTCAINCRHVYQTYHVLLDEHINRANLMEILRDNRIETNYGAYAVHMQKYYLKKYVTSSSSFPESIKSFHHGLALPLHTQMDWDELEFIVDTLIRILGSL
jgi:perosamine synthetase